GLAQVAILAARRTPGVRLLRARVLTRLPSGDLCPGEEQWPGQLQSSRVRTVRTRYAARRPRGDARIPRPLRRARARGGPGVRATGPADRVRPLRPADDHRSARSVGPLPGARGAARPRAPPIAQPAAARLSGPRRIRCDRGGTRRAGRADRV